MAISDLIQKNLSNLTGGGIAGIAGGVAGSLFTASGSSQAATAAAAKILNKSPLELNDKPTAHMDVNPYDYGTVWYPNNVQNLGTGHYMIFDILETDTIWGQAVRALGELGSTTYTALGNDNIAATLKPAPQTNRAAQIKNAGGGVENRITNQSSGINAGGVGSRHTRVVATIVLYTPPGIKTSYNVTHEGTETGMLGAALGYGGQGASIGSVTELAARAGEISSTLLAELGGAALAIIPGMGDLKGALQKVTGRAFNPNLEMVFKGVPMREFDYTFEFAPKNREELDSVQKIINLFKYHMHPLVEEGSGFVVPSQFQLTYMYLDKRNNYIPKISKCVLKTMDLQHGDETSFHTLVADEKGAPPIYTKMTLKFAETEIMTKQTTAKGF
jgi:hypothetical protein